MASARTIPETPTDGETVFLEAQIENRGRTAARAIQVTAREGATTVPSGRLESRIGGAAGAPPAPFDLDPGASATLRLRWDPFRDAGERKIAIEARPSGDPPELDHANNIRPLSLHVLSKFDLRPVDLQVQPPRDGGERRQRIVHLAARIENRGESPARGVRVVFYRTRRRDPRMVAGEASIDLIPGKSVAEAVIPYRLTEEETQRPFTPNCEAMLRGARQRVAFAGN